MKKLLLFFMSIFSILGYSQIQEDFEAALFPPTGWAVFDNGIGTSVSWGRTANTGLTYNASSGAAFLNRENVVDGTTALDWLVTPSVLVPANGQLRFFTRKTQAGNFGSIFTVRVSTTSQNNPGAFTTIQTWTESDLVTTFNVHEQKILPLTAYAGQNVYIAFVMENDNGDRWVVDNINVDTRCLNPTIQNVSNVSDVSVDLTWNNPSGASEWDIEWGPVGFVQGAGTLITGVSTNPYNLTGLTANTSYDFYVRANCGNNNISTWTGPFTFTTGLCAVSSQCNFIFRLTDSGNNGWQGNTMAVRQFGVLVATLGPTFTTGGGPVDISVPLCSSQPFELFWNSGGTSPAQVGVQIIDPNSLTLFTKAPGTGSQNSLLYSGVAACVPPTCPQPNSILVTGVNTNSGTITWSDNAGASEWQIIIQPAGTGYPPVGATPTATTTTTSYSFSGLPSASSYEIYISAVCSPTDQSFWSGPVNFATTPNYCGGNHFYDLGGPSAPYGNNQNVTTTICPENSGDVVMVIFNSFALESGFDFLRIYDGNSTSAPLLGTFTGNNLPPQFIASSASGCLTFNFTSDTSVTPAGWDATIICSPPPTCLQPTNLSVSNNTSEGATLSWTDTNSPSASNWQVVVQPVGSGYPTATSTTIPASTNPFTVTGLNPNSAYEFYVLADCGAADGVSFWTGPVSFNTLFAGCNGSTPAGNECAVAPPVCSLDGYCGNTSGTYTDNSWPALDAAFCGSIENNSFLSFQAASTSISLTVNVGNCTNGSGIQFMVFTTPACGSGPVTDLGCYFEMDPGVNNLTFTNLVPGQNYFLMIDGFAGAICDYSVTVTSGGSTTTDVVLTPENPTMCMGNSMTLNVTGGNGIYNWSPNTGLSAVTGPSVVFTPPAPGTYTVVVESTDTNPICSTQSSTVITVVDVVTPTFVQPTPICNGDVAPILPTTSTNAVGITGTWSPAVVSNTNSATYTFTPDAGQCAVTTTLDVVVLDQVAPSFLAPAPICSGDTAPVLSTTSNNGITGTWSPAIVDNLNSATYTFTPDAGQCAATTTLFVEVLTNCTFNAFATAVWVENCENSATDGDFYNITGSGSTLIGPSTNIFPNSDLGNYVQNSGNLIFRGAELKSFKTATSNVCSARLNYRVYEASTTPGAFTILNLPNLEDCVAGNFPTGGSCNAGDQRWQRVLSDLEAPLDLTTLAPGNYIIEVFFDLTGDNDSTTGCDDTILVNNNGVNYTASFSIQSSPIFAFTNPTSCNGNEGTITISGFTPNVTYNVSYSVDAVNVGPTSYIANATGEINIVGLNSGVYNNFSFTVNGCTFAAPDTITLVDPVYTPTFAPIGPFCVGDVITLPTTSIEGFTGTWDIPVDNTQTLSYIFIPTAGQCAQNSAPYTVVVNPAPSVTSLVSNSPICFGQDAVFTITGTANAQVTFNINGGVNQTATTDASGVYVYTETAPSANVTLNLVDIDNGNCNTSQNLTELVTVEPLPNITSFVAVDEVVCVGSNAEFNISGTSNAIVTYTVNGGTNQTLTLSSSGTYTLVFTTPSSDVVLDLISIESALCSSNLSLSATVDVVTIDVPAINITSQPSCSIPTASFTVVSPVNLQLNFPTNLIISEVFDAQVGALTYVEIYNGTGAAVDLSGYKLKTYLNGSTTPGCSLILSGILANDDVYLIKLGNAANAGGIVPDISFPTSCGGVNNNDNIRLTTSLDVEVDSWGTTNGTPFTPLNQTGYSYRRNISAPLPSLVWDPADWTALDPEEFTDLGTYSLFVSNYEYILDGTTTQTSVDFTGVTPGSHTLVAHDTVSGCYSLPFTFTINPIVFSDPVLVFSYDTPICNVSSANVLPVLSPSFTSGGEFTSTTGLSIDSATGEIDLSASTAGTYVITYSVLENVATCTNGGTSNFTIVISPASTTTFDAIEDVCLNSIFVLPTTSTEGYTGTWSPNVVNTNNVGTTTYTFTPDESFCANQVTLAVNVVNCKIQKGISPNNDGKNDYFDLTSYNVRKLEIFNRYGTKVYSFSNYQNEWYGQSDNGNELPDGTYYYVISLSDLEPKTGWIYINREQ